MRGSVYGNLWGAAGVSGVLPHDVRRRAHRDVRVLARNIFATRTSVPTPVLARWVLATRVGCRVPHSFAPFANEWEKVRTESYAEEFRTGTNWGRDRYARSEPKHLLNQKTVEWGTG